jgi:hypothetical protein
MVTFSQTLQFGQFNVGFLTDNRSYLTIQIAGQTPVDLNAPTLLKTSGAGINPMAWSSAYPNAIVWDGTNGTKVGMQYRINGGGWVTETLQGLTSDILLGGSFTWPNYSVQTFNLNDFVEVEEWIVQTVGGVQQSPTGMSNIISDTMATGTLFAPSSLFGVGDIGYAFNTTDGTKIWQSNAGTTAGVLGSVIGRVTDISGLGNHINSASNDTTRPLWQNSANGLIQFDGSNDRLLGIGGFYAKGTMTWVGAVKGASQSNFLWAENSGSGGSTAPIYAPGLRGDTAALMFNYQRNDANTALATAMAAALLDGALHMYMVEDTGTQLTLWVDGVQSAQAAYSRNAPLTGSASTFGVGKISGGDFGLFNGSIGSPFVISRVLTGAGPSTAASEKKSIYNYIAALHGLTTL